MSVARLRSEMTWEEMAGWKAMFIIEAKGGTPEEIQADLQRKAELGAKR